MKRRLLPGVIALLLGISCVVPSWAAVVSEVSPSVAPVSVSPVSVAPVTVAPVSTVPVPTPIEAVAPPPVSTPHKMSITQARALQADPERWATTVRIVSMIASASQASGSVYRPIPSVSADPTLGPWVARLFLASLDPNGVFLSRSDVSGLTDGPVNQRLWNDAATGKSMAPVFAAVALYKSRQKAALGQALVWVADQRIPYTDALWDPRSPVRLLPTPTAAPLSAHQLKSSDTLDGINRVGLVSGDWPVEPSRIFADSVQDDWNTAHTNLLHARTLPPPTKTSTFPRSDQEIDAKTWDTLKSGLTEQRDAVAAWTDEDATELFAHTLVQSVDPHADYMAPVSASHFDQMLMHAYTGIGVFWKEGLPPPPVLPLTTLSAPSAVSILSIKPSPAAPLLRPNPPIVVDRVLPGSPAEKAGLLAGDVLLALGTDKDKLTPAAGLRLSALAQLSDGPVGMPVWLRVRSSSAPDSSARLLAIPRETVHLDDRVVTARWVNYAPGAAITLRPAAGVHAFEPHALVVKVPDFYRDDDKPNRTGGSVTDDLRAVLRAAESGPGCTGLGGTPRAPAPPAWSVSPPGPCGLNLVVLDLRNNPGGLLTEAVRTVGLFVKDGPVVRTRAANGHTTSFNLGSDNVPVWNGPLLVLVNQHTASAAEIVTGALQDHHRAIIVGQPTYGKGSAQEIIDLDAVAGVPAGMGILGQIHVTGSAFFRPSGLSPQRIGIVPDVTLGLPSNHWALVLNGLIASDPSLATAPRSWIMAAARLDAWRATLDDPQFLLVRGKPAMSDREEGNFNALPSIRLSPQILPETASATGADPWVTHREDLQARAQQRWNDAPWAPWWMVTEQTKPLDRVLLDPTRRQDISATRSAVWSLWQETSRAVDQRLTVRASVSAATPTIWTSIKTSKPTATTAPSDVVLAAALGVASDAFGATNYPQPWLNTAAAAVPAWWGPSVSKAASIASDQVPPKSSPWSPCQGHP